MRPNRRLDRPRPSVLRAALAALAAAALVTACAPGLEGRYHLSGDLDRPEYARFQGELHVDDEGTGYALLDMAGQPTVRLPLCRTKRAEQTLVFEVDGAYPPGRTCDAMVRALGFRGEIGGHVLTGTVEDREGTRAGLWRAIRKFD